MPTPTPTLGRAAELLTFFGDKGLQRRVAQTPAVGRSDATRRVIDADGSSGGKSRQRGRRAGRSGSRRSRRCCGTAREGRSGKGSISRPNRSVLGQKQRRCQAAALSHFAVSRAPTPYTSARRPAPALTDAMSTLLSISSTWSFLLPLYLNRTCATKAC